MQLKEVSYENRIVAFIDILGFKELIKQSENDNHKINFIYNILNQFKNLEKTENWGIDLIEVEESAQYKGLNNFKIQENVNITAFSDSIVISVKAELENLNHSFSTFIAKIAYFGSLLMEEGILIRGGITYGKLIHNSTGIMFGQAMIDAYMLESKNAKFPRILLSDKLMNLLEYPLLRKVNRYPYHQYIQRFNDGCIGFHQMIFYQVMQNSPLFDEAILFEKLEKIRTNIIHGLNTNSEFPDVHEKFQWLKMQYNKLIIFDPIKFVDENMFLKGAQLKIEIFEPKNDPYDFYYE